MFQSPIDGQHPLIRLLASLYLNQHENSPHFLGPPVGVPPGGGGGGPAFLGPPLHQYLPNEFAGKNVDPSFNSRMQANRGAFGPQLGGVDHVNIAPGFSQTPNFASALVAAMAPNPRPNLPQY